MNLHRIKSCLYSQSHRLAISGRHFLNLAEVHLLDESGGVEVEPAACPEWSASADSPVRHVSAVSELYGSLGSFRMYRISQFFQLGNNLLSHPELVLKRQSASADRGICHGSHSDSSARHSNMIVEQFLRRTVARAHCLESSGTYCPVSQLYRPYLIWCEQFAHDASS